MRKLASFFVAIAILSSASSLLAREWTDSTGKYKFKADLITFSDRLAVLKRGDKKLVAVHVDKLSEADKEFIQAKQSEARSSTDASQQQTWTFVNGQQAIGRVVDYARKQVTV